MRVRFSRLPASFYREDEHKGTTATGKGIFNERAAIADAHQGVNSLVKWPPDRRVVLAQSGQFSIDYRPILEDRRSLS